MALQVIGQPKKDFARRRCASWHENLPTIHGKRLRRYPSFLRLDWLLAPRSLAQMSLISMPHKAVEQAATRAARQAAAPMWVETLPQAVQVVTLQRAVEGGKAERPQPRQRLRARPATIKSRTVTRPMSIAVVRAQSSA